MSIGKTLSIVLIMLVLASPINVVALNPQIYYKNILVIGGGEHYRFIQSLMIFESNVEVLDGRLTKDLISRFDIIVYVEDGDLDIELFLEWFNTGGKLLIIAGYGEEANNILRLLGSSIRVSRGDGLEREMVFSPPEIPDYNFEETVVGRQFTIPRDITITILSERDKLYTLEYSDGETAFAVEYLPVYSDLFTLYHSKIIVSSTSLENIPDDVALELLSWGVTVYLSLNIISLSLTASLILGMTGVYAALWVIRRRSFT